APRREGVRGRGPLVHGTGRLVDGPPPQPPPPRLLRARGRGRLAADPRLLRPAPGEALTGADQPVAAISTAQGAWWLNLLGTLPRTKRLLPLMPLLPTMMRSACSPSATSISTWAGSPGAVWTSTFTPVARSSSASWATTCSAFWPSSAERRRASTDEAPATIASAERALIELTDLKALTRCTLAPHARASSAAWRTARAAEGEPSVPTTMDENIGATGGWPRRPCAGARPVPA